MASTSDSCPHQALSDWMAMGGMEPIMDGLIPLLEELVNRSRDIEKDDFAESIHEAGHDHPWTKIEEILWLAGYQWGRNSGENDEPPIKEESPIQWIYVVATGDYRFAVESEVPLNPQQAFEKALPRFQKLGCDLCQMVEITVCSDHDDASDPYYINTASALEKLGMLTAAP